MLQMVLQSRLNVHNSRRWKWNEYSNVKYTFFYLHPMTHLNPTSIHPLSVSFSILGNNPELYSPYRQFHTCRLLGTHSPTPLLSGEASVPLAFIAQCNFSYDFFHHSFWKAEAWHASSIHILSCMGIYDQHIWALDHFNKDGYVQIDSSHPWTNFQH